MWIPIWEKPPRFSSSGMRNGYSTLQPETCKLCLRYVFLTQYSISHALRFILLSTPIDPHTAWIKSSTLLAVCAHSCKTYGSIAFYLYYLSNLLNLHNFLYQSTQNNPRTLIQSGFLLLIASTRPHRVD